MKAEGDYMNLLRSLFDPNFLMSGIAIVRDIPRASRLKQVEVLPLLHSNLKRSQISPTNFEPIKRA